MLDFLNGCADNFLRGGIVHLYHVNFFGVIRFEDFLAQPLEVNTLGITDCLDHREVILADTVVDEFLVYSFAHGQALFGSNILQLVRSVVLSIGSGEYSQ